MTPLTAWLLAAAAVAAVTDWVAVARDDRRLELAAKPAVLALLVGAALALDPADAHERAWFVAALLLSLAGDVFLLFEERWFLAGLGSFLLAHLAYVVGFLVAGQHVGGVLVGLVVVVALVATLGRRVMRAAADPAVVGYVAVISLMVVTAFGSASWAAIAGAGLFYVSDLTLGWRRFVVARPWMDLVVIVTYHLAQGLLVVHLLG